MCVCLCYKEEITSQKNCYTVFFFNFPDLTLFANGCIKSPSLDKGKSSLAHGIQFVRELLKLFEGNKLSNETNFKFYFSDVCVHFRIKGQNEVLTLSA